MIEWRVFWEASSNHSFGGTGEWQVWDGDQSLTEDQVEEELVNGGGGGLSLGLETAMEESGFGWSVETREVDDDREDH